jgi:hypothetical protein
MKKNNTHNMLKLQGCTSRCFKDNPFIQAGSKTNKIKAETNQIRPRKENPRINTVTRSKNP